MNKILSHSEEAEVGGVHPISQSFVLIIKRQFFSQSACLPGHIPPVL